MRGFTLDVQNDGNLVIYGVGGATWARSSSLSGGSPDETLNAGQAISSPNGTYELIMQTDGNLIIYNHGNPLWDSATSGAGNHATMQSDGNLVVYHGSAALWQSGTGGQSGGFTLDLQNDGNLVIYSVRGATWSRITGVIGGPAAAAISWAEAQDGKNLDDGLCLLFVAQAYAAANVNIGSVGSSNGAYQYWQQDPKGYTEHPGDTTPPAGALVF